MGVASGGRTVAGPVERLSCGDASGSVRAADEPLAAAIFPEGAAAVDTRAVGPFARQSAHRAARDGRRRRSLQVSRCRSSPKAIGAGIAVGAIAVLAWPIALRWAGERAAACR
ncbi:hypothetical protein WS62_30775 [Burkholderia sp. ABCPW 14]|nr:hypothetical protein WS62_30775 [Burkholderia sp. ABCPW 14]